MRQTNGQPATDEPTFLPLDHRPEHDRPTPRHVTVAEAAVLLGISEDAVRSRLKRGTLRKEKAADGTVLVILGDGGSADRQKTGQATGQPTGQPADQTDLVEALRQQVEHLSRIIDTRDEEIRRRDTIIMSLAQRVPELEGPSDPPGDERDGVVSPSEEPGKGVGGEDREKPLERRSWWRRFFGF